MISSSGIRVMCVMIYLVAASLAVSAEYNNSTSAQTACRVLSATLGAEKVQFAGSAQYVASVSSPWDPINRLDDPSCIVFPRNSSDVVVAMRTIFISDAHYAVRGGGHSAMPGWNTVQDGVLIDFSQMKAFSYDPVRDSIFIEPGVLLGEVYDGLESQGVAPVGGRVETVGFSGLALGGGLSFLSPSQGWACDRYRSLDVVLTNGRLVTATGTNKHSDLFRALKGGGSRFGIVTRFEVDAIHTGTAADKILWGGSITYPNTSSVAVIKALDDLIYLNEDPNAEIIATGFYSFSGIFPTGFSVVLFYNGTEAKFNKVFAEFLAIPASATSLGPISYNNATKLVTGTEIGRTHTNVWGASAIYPGQGLFEKAYNNWLNFSIDFKDELSITLLAITPVFQSQIDISNAHGGTVFTPPDGAFAYIQTVEMLPTGVTNMSTRLRAGIDLLYRQVPPSPGLPLYLNESEDVQDALTTYSRYEELKRTYAKYDPTRFNVRRMVGPNGL